MRNAILRDMRTCSLDALLVLRARTMHTPNLGETRTRLLAPAHVVIRIACMPTLAAADAVLVCAPGPLLALAGDFDAVDDVLEGARGGVRGVVGDFDLEVGWKNHLHRADECHGRVVARGVRVAVLEIARGDEG